MSAPLSELLRLNSSGGTALQEEMQELERDLLDVGLQAEPRSCCAALSEEQAKQIRLMTASEQSPVLEAICHCLDEHSKLAGGGQLLTSEDSPIQNLMKFLYLDPQRAKEKPVRPGAPGVRGHGPGEEVPDPPPGLVSPVRPPAGGHRAGHGLGVHLAPGGGVGHAGAPGPHPLPEVGPAGRPGVGPRPALEMGQQHLPAVLRANGHARQGEDPALGGQHSLAHGVLLLQQQPRSARPPFLTLRLLCSRPRGQDETLKGSFLSAAMMLARSLRQEPGTQNYRFSQIPELVQCLLCVLQQEPNFPGSVFRQKAILVIAELSKLRPHLKPLVKARVLHVCFRSVFELPPADPQAAPEVTTLYKETLCALHLLLRTFLSEDMGVNEVCFLLQHTEPWLRSDRSHERQRVVQCIFRLLQYVVDSLKFAVSALHSGLGEDSGQEGAMPSALGHHVGLLTLLWCDKEETTRKYSQQCVTLLLQLTVLQRAGRMAVSMRLSKLKQSEIRASRDWEVKLYSAVKAFERDLTVAQHTQLVLTLLPGLCSHSRLSCDLASKLLLLMFEGPGLKPEQVAEVLQSLFQQLPHIPLPHVQQDAMRAVTVLGTQHPQETVEVVLSLCHPSERRTLPLWKALATNHQLACKVITLLYMKLKLRPPRGLTRPSSQTQLISLLALGTIYELLYTQEYRQTIHWAFAGILLGLLTQLHYLFELGVVEDVADYQEDILDSKPLSPFRTCLEAVKGLFWTTSYWEVFAYIQLLQGWALLERPDTYGEGVSLLARAMVQYDCEVKAVLGQAVISLKSMEERDNVVAILLLTEFLNSAEVFQQASRKKMDTLLNLGLGHCNQLVRAMSLKGLSSTTMHPKKVFLLRNRLAGLLDSFLRPDTKDLLGLMGILGDILHRLGLQGAGSASIKLAQHLLSLFEDEREEVRSGAIFLFGDVIDSGSRKFRQAFKTLAFQAVVPLLLHMADPCPTVVTKSKSTLLRCALLLKWEFRKELFGKLAWGRGPGAENDIFVYMVESNFGKYPQFLLQALVYLKSPHRPLKLAAMKFIDLEPLEQDPDAACRRFYRNFVEDITELSRSVT
ncbi:maestro heat-like repeat family member 5 isoform X4 [Oryctolagus cuniculus]|uniref:maestro heat-like repeat family member 5 isoform X4 n=1 Tax=Oryctolagus cuniculus TaxID=9986 RepID=UPI0038798BDC